MTERRTSGAPVRPAGEHTARLGGTALLRLAGVPVAAWTGAGNPGLFARISADARARAELAGRARKLAGDLGTLVVPDPELGAAERRSVLALRRRLHAGATPGPADQRLLDASAAVPAELAAEAAALSRCLRELDLGERLLREAVAQEWQRAGTFIWERTRSAPTLRGFLDTTAPELLTEAERLLMKGELWRDRRLRKTGAYLWRILARSAAKSTPRGWLGQIAPLPVLDSPAPVLRGGPLGADTSGTALLPYGVTVADLSAETAENVFLLRTRLAGTDLVGAPPGTLVAPAPLQFLSTGPAGPAPDVPQAADAVVCCQVVDPAAPDRMREIRLRRTRPLHAVLTLLAERPRSLGELESALLGADGASGASGADGAERRRAVLRGFLAHLHGLGVLQVCAPPHRRCARWTTAYQVRDGARLPGAGAAPGWFTDSHRSVRAEGADGPGVPADAVATVREGLAIAARLAGLARAEGLAPATPRSAAALTSLGADPRPLRDVLAEALAAPPDTGAVPAHRHPGWSPARTADSGYGRLLALLGDRGTRPGDGGPVVLDHRLLDGYGAPPADSVLPHWPVDCLLRPAGSGPAVLQSASPAGVADARFTDALHALHGSYDNVEGYRTFLEAVERVAGVRFVELLVPPLADFAANAVRRPLTTGWWTGDPDPTAYFGTARPAARYLPLDRITLRWEGTRLIAEADGRRIVPIHHATRVAPPPYGTLMRLLLTAGHPGTTWLLRLDGPLAALGPVRHCPRVRTGPLVIAPAQWRVDRARLWRRGDDDLTRARGLADLRASAGLPRHVFVRSGPGAKSLPLDLAALPALGAIERLCAREPGTELVFEEMLPLPGDLPVRDPLHGRSGTDPAVAAQLLLRLPQDRGIDELARSAAAVLCGDTDVPAPPAAGGPGSGAEPVH
ncbi:lantibiotic dehydratase [Streptomyces sp. NEAU-Y11]|uniref:lantibiotic dehydratase n=1 Tax=Streptomyces cucumeris TaxID=2962890 RepID=UPI0020C8D4A7|nr:lantibiotic dehydratase [Streptomyces sp. NEAU-Y11]MCP9206691.1 lantibiotic dehydratase family protein [Streptomyces sp. NEAU-Y11]